MGAYLTKPCKEKIAEDGQYGKIVFGSCSMQGWRVSQEDSHNCLPEFDTHNQTSLFAVYDGHGGAEVAKYCSAELPNFLTSLPSYQDEKDLSKALTETFLGFDASLLEERTIEKLRQLSESGKDEPRLDDEEDEEDDASLLKEEATLPLENVLEKYGGIESLPPVLKSLMMLHKKQEFKSPCLSKRRKKKQEAEVSSSGDTVDNSDEEAAGEEEGAGSSSQSQEKSGSSTSSTEEKSGELKDKEVVNGVCDEKKSKEKSIANGDVTSECIKENGIGEDTNGTCEMVKEDGAAVPKKKVKERMAVDEEDEEDEEWNGAGNKDGAVEEGEEENEEEEDEDDDDDSGVDEEEDDEDEDDEDDDDDDDDDEDDDDEDEDEVDEESAVLSFGQQMDDSEPGVDSGTTAVVAVIRGNNLVVANAGDSRCVLCRAGGAVDLSVDHKPEDEPEKDRITKAGGVVTQEGRVNGGLNLSRAIGDHSYKKNDELGPSEQMITASPDIQTTELDPEKDEFMVLACDGIWNSLNSQEVVDFVRERLNKEGEMKLSDICGELFDSCLAEDTVGDGTGCDNMTCIIVKFDWKAKEPTPTIGKLVKGVKRAEPPHDASDANEEQTAKKIRVESD